MSEVPLHMNGVPRLGFGVQSFDRGNILELVGTNEERFWGWGWVSSWLWGFGCGDECTGEDEEAGFSEYHAQYLSPSRSCPKLIC